MKYFTSDTHYSHSNICRGTSKWGSVDENGSFIVSNKTRDFSCLSDMNNSIVDNINAVVKENDELYHLGDVSFGGIENLWNFRKRINCKNIHLILGNHDGNILKNRTLPNCYWDSDHKNILDGDSNSIEEIVYARDLFSSIQDILLIKENKISIIMCHYPQEYWEDSEKGSWHLHGHLHGGLPQTEFKRIDVGLDANSQFKPFSFEDIKLIMSNKKSKKRHI